MVEHIVQKLTLRLFEEPLFGEFSTVDLLLAVASRSF